MVADMAFPADVKLQLNSKALAKFDLVTIETLILKAVAKVGVGLLIVFATVK